MYMDTNSVNFCAYSYDVYIHAFCLYVFLYNLFSNLSEMNAL